MDRIEALDLIDKHKNVLVNPVEMLHWTHLRVIISQIPDDDWEKAMDKAHTILSQ